MVFNGDQLVLWKEQIVTGGSHVLYGALLQACLFLCSKAAGKKENLSNRNWLLLALQMCCF